MEILSQGAEAVIYKLRDSVVKQRVVKSYRLPSIDENLRKLRTRREAKVIDKLNYLGICAPKLVSMCDKDMKIEMEFVDGEKLRDCLHKNHIKYSYEIGKSIAKMHENHIVHGDLTTSNMILHNEELCLIDFGLSFFSHKVEDKAVDLHLLDRALASKHNEIYEECFAEALRGYKENYPESELVLNRLEKVQNRGRNKNH